MASSKAFEDEKNAFRKISSILGDSSKPFQEPAGADAGFPDFGFTTTIANKKIDLHIEYKNSHTAQMGSMRDWRFDGRVFSTPDTESEQKQELITLMNGTQSAVANGQRLLKDLQKYFSPEVKEIYSGSLTVIKEKSQRWALTKNFADNTRDYQIANIADTSLGNKIIQHYKTKFSKSKNTARARGHILMMMIKDEIWLMDTSGEVSIKDKETIAGLFGVNKINQLSGLTAALEVRIQPRGLSTPGKPTSIDVMASYRLKGKPVNGAKII